VDREAVGLRGAGLARSTHVAARELTFVPCSDRFLATLETFRAQSDRGLSFADAAIVTMARLHPPGRVATFDRALGAVEPIPV
jgi:predicted nucleic acid-binding protein